MDNKKFEVLTSLSILVLYKVLCSAMFTEEVWLPLILTKLGSPEAFTIFYFYLCLTFSRLR